MTKHLLIVNPNTNAQVTHWFAEEAARVAGDRFEIVAVNAESGLAALQTPEDIETAERAVVEAVRAHPADAVIVAAFGDPGLKAARAATRAPVVGLGEAGMRAAAKLGPRFTIVTLGADMRATIGARAGGLGLSDKLDDVKILPFSIPEMIADREARLADIAAAVRGCAPGAVLLGGAPFAGLAAAVARETGRIVIDGVEACVDTVSTSWR